MKHVAPINHPDQWYGGRTYAQHGDDLAVLNIFKRLRIERPSYIDFGAHHPFILSNTALLYERGSRGVNVDANKRLMAEFVRYRTEDANIYVAVGTQPGQATFHMINEKHGCNSLLPVARAKSRAVVDVMTADEIVDLYAKGVWPDFLTIDIEGMDVAVLSSIDFSQRSPKVICAEAVSPSGDASDALRSLMVSRGYFVHSWCGSNMLFVRSEFMGLLR